MPKTSRKSPPGLGFSDGGGRSESHKKIPNNEGKASAEPIPGRIPETRSPHGAASRRPTKYERSIRRGEATTPRTHKNVREKRSGSGKDGEGSNTETATADNNKHVDAFRKISYINTRSILSNDARDDTLSKLISEDPTIIAISETWFVPGMTKNEVSIAGYDLIARCDRVPCDEKKWGGGVAIYAKNGIKPKRVYSKEITPFVQICGAQIGQRKIFCVYVAPDRKYAQDADTVKYLKRLCQGVDSYVVGDFNLRKITPDRWNTDLLPRNATKIRTGRGKTRIEILYHRFMLDTGMTQKVRAATHKDGKTLDLVFSNEDLIRDDEVEIVQGLITSDHYLLNFWAKISQKDKDGRRRVVDDFSRANFGNYRNMINRAEISKNCDWNDDIDQIYDFYTKAIESAYRKIVPSKTVKGSEPRWFNTNVRGCVNRLKRLRKNKASKDIIKVAGEELKAATRKARIEFETRFVEAARKDSKIFFEKVRRLRQSDSTIMPLSKADGTVANDDLENANLFNEAFNSVYLPRRDRPISWTNNSDSDEERYFEKFTFTKKEIRKAIMKIKNDTSPGCDGITATMLKKAADCLSGDLRFLFQHILDNELWPKKWGKSIVVPIPKKETDKSNPLSYRPISLQCLLLKVFEAVLLNRLDIYLNEKKFFAKNQHGFSAGASTITNLMPYWNDVTKNLEKGQGMTVVCLDIKKGFDRVDVDIALKKIKEAGIRGKVGRFFENWMTKRSQSVKIGQSISAPLTPTSGTPQGDCLSPRVFNIFINDIVKRLETCSSWYADDAKLYSNCSNLMHSIALQKKLDIIDNWAKDNKVEFSVNKCAVVKIGQCQIDYDYMLNGQVIKEEEEFMDLGVKVSNNADFTDHLAKVAKKVSGIVHQFRKNFKFKTINMMRTYYKTIFIPILLYGSNIWFQAKARIFALLQKSFDNFWSLSNAEIPNDILTPMQYVRYFDLCCVKRIRDGKTCLNFGDFYHEIESGTRASRNRNVKNVKCNNQVRLDSFFVRSVEEWNAVPPAEKDFKVKQFKIFARSHVRATRRHWRPARDSSIGRVTRAD